MISIQIQQFLCIPCHPAYLRNSNVIHIHNQVISRIFTLSKFDQRSYGKVKLTYVPFSRSDYSKNFIDIAKLFEYSVVFVYFPFSLCKILQWMKRLTHTVFCTVYKSSLTGTLPYIVYLLTTLSVDITRACNIDWTYILWSVNNMKC